MIGSVINTVIAILGLLATIHILATKGLGFMRYRT